MMPITWSTVGMSVTMPVTRVLSIVIVTMVMFWNIPWFVVIMTMRFPIVRVVGIPRMAHRWGAKN